MIKNVCLTLNKTNEKDEENLCLALMRPYTDINTQI